MRASSVVNCQSTWRWLALVPAVSFTCERRPDGDQRSAAQAGGSPFDEQVKVRSRCCTGRILLLYWQQERPSPILVRAYDLRKHWSG